jgi:hypothetical protein
MPLAGNIRNTEIDYGDKQAKLLYSQQPAHVVIRGCKIIKDVNVTLFNNKKGLTL